MRKRSQLFFLLFSLQTNPGIEILKNFSETCKVFLDNSI